MNIAKQLKEIRISKKISQEELAEIIHVSRQTISSWENERSYPDIQSLMLLSDFYKISLDDLVKGDINMMREKLEIKRMNYYAYGMVASFVEMLITIPLTKYYGLVGFGVSAIGMIGILFCGFKLEQIKKDKNIYTYKEILNYMDNGVLPTKPDKRPWKQQLVISILVGVFTFILVYTLLLFV